MAVNADKPDRWGSDTEASVALYNRWFTDFAPRAYENVRREVEGEVRVVLDVTDHFRDLSPDVMLEHPEILGVLRMATSPPLAVDRLRGLASVDVSKNTMNRMESGEMPPRMGSSQERQTAEAIADVVSRMLDHDLFDWLESGAEPDEASIRRATAVVAERVATSRVNPILRNAQEERQFDVLAEWLGDHDYERRRPPRASALAEMSAGTYAFHLNVEGGSEGRTRIPVDVVIQPHHPRPSGLPLLVEAKSAGDFTNVNKRRKEEAAKARQLRERYGDAVEYVLLLGGYFDRGYLEYESRHGIDWVWEHRVEDFEHFGL